MQTTNNQKNTRWSAIDGVGKDTIGATSADIIQGAGLDWKVNQSPVLFRGSAGVLEENKDYKVNFRSDNGTVLGVVGDGYKILQNSEAFRFLDSVVGSSEAMYVNAGSFKGGRKIYIQAKLPGYIHFDDGDDVGEKYLTFLSSHDGSLSVSVLFTPVRIICQNTMVKAVKQSDHRTTSKHTSSLFGNLEMARTALKLVGGQVALLESLSRKLIVTPFREQEMDELLEKTGLIPKTDKASTRAQNIITEVLGKYRYGSGSQFKTSQGTRWGAYNAISEYVDHFRGSDPVKRAESLLLGSGARIKEKALELLAG